MSLILSNKSYNLESKSETDNSKIAKKENKRLRKVKKLRITLIKRPKTSDTTKTSVEFVPLM